MKAYHVTSRENAVRILEDGLSPTCTRGEKAIIPERACVLYAFPRFEDVKHWKAPGVILEVDIPDTSLVGDFQKSGEAMNIKQCIAKKGIDVDPLDPAFWFRATGKCSVGALEQSLREYKEGLVPLKDYKGEHKEPEILMKEPIPPEKVRIAGVKWQYMPTGTGIIKSGSGPEYIDRIESFEGLERKTHEHNEELARDRDLMRKKMIEQRSPQNAERG